MRRGGCKHTHAHSQGGEGRGSQARAARGKKHAARPIQKTDAHEGTAGPEFLDLATPGHTSRRPHDAPARPRPASRIRPSRVKASTSRTLTWLTQGCPHASGLPPHSLPAPAPAPTPAPQYARGPSPPLTGSRQGAPHPPRVDESPDAPPESPKRPNEPAGRV